LIAVVFSQLPIKISAPHSEKTVSGLEETNVHVRLDAS